MGNEEILYCLQSASFLNCWKSAVTRVDAVSSRGTGRSCRRSNWGMLWQAMMLIRGRLTSRWWRSGREKRHKNHKAERLGEIRMEAKEGDLRKKQAAFWLEY